LWHPEHHNGDVCLLRSADYRLVLEADERRMATAALRIVGDVCVNHGTTLLLAARRIIAHGCDLTPTPSSSSDGSSSSINGNSSSSDGGSDSSTAQSAEPDQQERQSSPVSCCPCIIL
jgi:hypothetical protein